ncbi:MAG: type II toxin-antitoxin system HicA family toxin [Planctomycetaceae bacterium]|nr:type II toxin-antitoxin system HicA family toxin [Planctomycetota bacterium]NUN51660.1 type II toxin-antitoxin system HicA family toxin [Planctomycetaceae bacterium]
MKVREALRIIVRDGWFLAGCRGSHRQYLHPWKPGKVTIAGRPSMELAPKTWKSILRQAGLEERP